MAATRKLTRYFTTFNAADEVIEFAAETLIVTDDLMPDGQGGSMPVELRQTYVVIAANLPAQFVTDLETLAGKVRTRLDADFPMP